MVSCLSECGFLWMDLCGQASHVLGALSHLGLSYAQIISDVRVRLLVVTYPLVFAVLKFGLSPS